jgi:hypothetical protein
MRAKLPVCSIVFLFIIFYIRVHVRALLFGVTFDKTARIGCWYSPHHTRDGHGNAASGAQPRGRLRFGSQYVIPFGTAWRVGMLGGGMPDHGTCEEQFEEPSP